MNNEVKVPDMRVNIAGVVLKNPVITASGTCGFGREYLPYYSPSALGAITVKGLTLEPREGNKTPRIAETPSGILNSIGLQNPGVECFIANELPNLKKYDTMVIANIAGRTIEEYVRMAEILSDTAVDMLEVNVSCPNVKEGGVAFGTDPALIEKITGEVKKVSSKPVIIKLSPNVTNIKVAALAASGGGADAVSLINTLLGMKIDIKTRRPVLRNNVGGLSGPAVRPVAVRMVCDVASVVDIPVIGMGGIETADDALEFILAGASAVSVGTAAFMDPFAPVKIRDGLYEYCRQNDIDAVSRLTGAVRLWEN